MFDVQRRPFKAAQKRTMEMECGERKQGLDRIVEGTAVDPGLGALVAHQKVCTNGI